MTPFIFIRKLQSKRAALVKQASDSIAAHGQEAWELARSHAMYTQVLYTAELPRDDKDSPRAFDHCGSHCYQARRHGQVRALSKLQNTLRPETVPT